MRRVEANATALLRQAHMTASDYMQHAVSNIDDLMGKGYAAKHPELIGAYMQTAAIDFGSAVIAGAIEEEWQERATPPE